MSNVTEKDYYELLGVSRDATAEQIKLAYRDLARVYHPDSNYYAEIIDTPMSERDQQIFKYITAAYDTLMDPEKKAAYDRTLLNGVPKWEAGREAAQEVKVGRPIRPVGSWAEPIERTNADGRQEYRVPFGGIGREDYVTSGMLRQTRPVSDFIQSAKRTLMDKMLLFLGLGLPILTLGLALVYILWFAKKH